MADPNDDRDADELPPSPGEPWAKTSSGDAEHVTDDEDDEGD